MAARTAGRPYGALGRMGIVAGIHVAVLMLIANSLGLHPLKLAAPADIELIDPSVPRPLETPPPPVQPQQLDPLVPVLPMPDFPATPIDDAGAISVDLRPVDRIPVDNGSAVPMPVLVGVQSDARHPLSQPPYPSGDIRQGNEGTAVLEIYVLPNGRVGDARVVKSTGFDSLDRSALAEAKRSWRLKPATRDGVPYAEWHKLSVTFRLENR